jgi:hypothetical protein
MDAYHSFGKLNLSESPYVKGVMIKFFYLHTYLLGLIVMSLLSFTQNVKRVVKNGEEQLV